MKAIAIKCACGARPGEKCIDIGYGDEPMSPTKFHLSRIRSARLTTTVEARERAAAQKKLRERKVTP